MNEIKNLVTIDKWYGMYSRKGSHLIGDNFLANSLNVSVADGSIAPFKMYSVFANRVTGGQITNAFTTVKANGTEIPLRVRDDGTNSHIEWYNSVNETWETLLANQTTGKVPSFADFNTSTQDEVWWCNGTENLTLWTKAVGSVASNFSNSITLNEDAATAGFSAAGGTVIVDGTEYPYAAISGNQITGLSGIPDFTVNAGVAEAADDSTYSAVAKMDILVSNNARMWGAISTKPRLYYSEVGNAANWTTGTVPDDPGFRDFVEGEGGITGLAAIQENVIVFKRDLVQLYKLEFPTSATRVSISKAIKQGDSVGAVNHHGIIKIGDEIIYTTSSGGVKSVFLSKEQEAFDFADITDNIRPTIKNGVFTSARATYHEKERRVLIAYKKNSDSTRNDKVIVIEIVKDDNEQYLKALGFLDWTVGGWFKYDSDVYFGSSFISETYKAFDGYSKDGGPFTALASTKRYRFSTSPVQQKEILFMPVTGWISSGTTLKFQLEYDYLGSRALVESELAGTETDYIIEPQVNVIGAFAMGTEPIGGTMDDIDELNYFKVFFTLPPQHHPYDVQLTVYSDKEGARYKLETISFDAVDAKFVVDGKLKKAFK